MSLISIGAFRRMTQPLLFKFWFKRGTLRPSTYRVDGFELRVTPTVFHPQYFGSSRMFGRFLEQLELKNRRFLDMGTGSGVIGLYASRAGADVTSVDINPEAVRCAADNASAAGLRTRTLVSDLFAGLGDETFDVIAWNPPFFPQAPSSVAEAAVYAGPQHETIRRFAYEVRKHLSPDGVIYLIFSIDGGLGRLESIFQDSGFRMNRVRTEKWGLAELMVIFEIR